MNLNALESRLTSTCSRSDASPATAGSSPISTRTARSGSRACRSADDATVRWRLSSTSAGVKGVRTEPAEFQQVIDEAVHASTSGPHLLQA